MLFTALHIEKIHVCDLTNYHGTLGIKRTFHVVLSLGFMGEVLQQPS